MGRRSTLARNVVVGAALTGALVLAATDIAHAGGAVRGSAAKSTNGPYLEDTLTATVKAGKSKDLYLKAKNTSPNVDHEVFLLQSTEDDNYRIKYFRKDTNITASVQDTEGYGFHLEDGQAKKFRVRVKVPASGSASPFCLESTFSTPILPATDVTRIGLNGSTC